jgi:hypothetical protein
LYTDFGGSQSWERIIIWIALTRFAIRTGLADIPHLRQTEAEPV